MTTRHLLALAISLCPIPAFAADAPKPPEPERVITPLNVPARKPDPTPAPAPAKPAETKPADPKPTTPAKPADPAPTKPTDPTKKEEPKDKHASKPTFTSKEDEFYKVVTIPLPHNAVLEVGGLAWLDTAQTQLLVATRRGEIWRLDNVYHPNPILADPKGVQFKQMVFGLHEPLGLFVDFNSDAKSPWVYTAQRGEVSRLRDDDADGRFDQVQTFSNEWEISGSYHEFNFGPVPDKDGNLVVTLNRPFGGGQEGKALWRGWAVRIDKKTGQMTPICTGLRSPAGVGALNDGEVFYTDNQGDWVPACKLAHIKPLAFHGQETGHESMGDPRSPFKTKPAILKETNLLWPDAVKKIPELTPPAVWFPYPRMGKSHGEPRLDPTAGKFGPFAGQTFVADQGTSQVLRCFLEKIDGEYQGACFPFRSGLQSGAMRLLFGHDGSLFVGQTARGWGAPGGKPYGLQRIAWTGKTPFEIHEMRAKPDGFELTFTAEVDPKTAADPASYYARRWTYKHHQGYGCPPTDAAEIKVTKATVAPDNKSVRLTIDGLRPIYVHELRADGVRNKDNKPLLHPEAYYTLNRIPK
ncbi:MAG TPA: hypothetical protein VEA69_15100 [Tepidisphaeraceae bacterium]|nr:hypothetical protein [Tepidisphaeraceae bacterium]